MERRPRWAGRLPRKRSPVFVAHAVLLPPTAGREGHPLPHPQGKPAGGCSGTRGGHRALSPPPFSLADRRARLGPLRLLPAALRYPHLIALPQDPKKYSRVRELLEADAEIQRAKKVRAWPSHAASPNAPSTLHQCPRRAPCPLALLLHVSPWATTPRTPPRCWTRTTPTRGAEGAAATAAERTTTCRQGGLRAG